MTKPVGQKMTNFKFWVSAKARLYFFKFIFLQALYFSYSCYFFLQVSKEDSV